MTPSDQLSTASAWVFEDSDGTGANAAACVGPGVVTVTQVKTFSTGGGIVID